MRDCILCAIVYCKNTFFSFSVFGFVEASEIVWIFVSLDSKGKLDSLFPPSLSTSFPLSRSRCLDIDLYSCVLFFSFLFRVVLSPFEYDSRVLFGASGFHSFPRSIHTRMLISFFPIYILI